MSIVTSAYVLIQTDVGKGSDVARALAAIPGVDRVAITLGPYEVLLAVSGVLVALAALLLLSSLWLVRSPTGDHAWRLFKLTFPYLAVLFALLALNAAIVR